MSVLQKLTEGIVNRDLQKEGTALLNKWEKTGLLEGIDQDHLRSGMAVLLENQAKELLREASTMAAGDVEGFAAVAFPLVRRVFGGLIANDLVSVQPMSLPSGLIFFMDFQHTNTRLGTTGGTGLAADSLYGGGAVGHQITGGVNLTGDNAEKSFYNLNSGYSSPTGSCRLLATLIAGGTVGLTDSTDLMNKLTRYDADLSGSTCVVVKVTGSSVGQGTETALSQLNLDNLVAISVTGALENNVTGGSRLVRRLTQIHSGSTADDDPSSANFQLQLVFESTNSTTEAELQANAVGGGGFGISFPLSDNFNNVTETGGRGLGAVVGADTWGLEDDAFIPEIDIKVDSISVTAVTKKLKAKWTPELGQDLNAYHNLDAEVELTGILSEQIALEIDREILEDLIKGAQAGTYYWSRSPGKFVHRTAGHEVGATTVAPDFTGTVSEWYETLAETINDVSAQIHRKTLRGGANFVVCGPEVANVLEFTSGFRADVTGDVDRGTVGAVKTGSLSKKWDVYVDPYFPRNLILVGRKGGSFLESGYVYAPYVPLQVTPTIFGIEDFVPRKGVMTRYAKKMVRPDFYGLVVVQDLLG